MVLPKELAEARAQRAIESQDTSSELLAITPNRFELYVSAFKFIKLNYPISKFELSKIWYTEQFTVCFDLSKGVIWCSGGITHSNSVASFVASFVTKIYMLKDISKIKKAPMLCARNLHTSLYHRGYIYAIGGKDKFSYHLSCERYSICDDRWEFIDTLPYNCISKTAIFLESTQSIYLFGGNLCSILYMELERLTWKIHSVNMPKTLSEPAIFKIDETQVFIVGNERLYVFDPSLTLILNAGPTKMDYLSGFAYLFKGVFYKFNDL